MAADWEALSGQHMGGWAKFMAYAWTILGVLSIGSSFLPGREWWALLGAGWLLVGLVAFWRAYRPHARSLSATEGPRVWRELAWPAHVATVLVPFAVISGLKAWFGDDQQIFGSAQLLFGGLWMLIGWKWGRISTRLDSAGIRHADTLSRQNCFFIPWGEVSDIELNTVPHWATHLVVETNDGQSRPLRLLPPDELDEVRSFLSTARGT